VKFFLLAASLIGAAPMGHVDVTARVDHSSITIGDRVRYDIEIAYPDSGRVELPEVLGNLGAFEVKDYQTRSGKAADGRTTITHSFVISTFTVGDYALPPQRVEYREGKDTAALVLYTQPTAIQVKRTSPETVKDIADIADVADLPEPMPWGLIALGALIAALFGFLAWRKWGRKIGTKTKVPPPLPPYEEALQRLRAINTVQLLRHNRAREFAFDLSEILRNYVGRRYSIDALESTTEEFLEKVKPLSLPAGQLSWMRSCCVSLDQVKYATGGMLETEAARLVHEVEQFLEYTRPSSEPSNAATGEKK
jgi:hypothetical protein